MTGEGDEGIGVWGIDTQYVPEKTTTLGYGQGNACRSHALSRVIRQLSRIILLDTHMKKTLNRCIQANYFFGKHCLLIFLLRIVWFAALFVRAFSPLIGVLFRIAHVDRQTYLLRCEADQPTGLPCMWDCRTEVPVHLATSVKGESGGGYLRKE